MTWEAADETTVTTYTRVEGEVQLEAKKITSERKKNRRVPNSGVIIGLFLQTVFRNNKLSGNGHDGLPANSQCVNDKSITKKTDTSAKERAYKQTYVPN